MNQQYENTAQRRQEIERSDLFAATGGQRWLVLQEERHVRAKCDRDILELPGVQRLAEKFVQSKDCVGCVGAASAQSGGERKSFLQMDAYPLGAARHFQKLGRGAMDQIRRIHRQRRMIASRSEEHTSELQSR